MKRYAIITMTTFATLAVPTFAETLELRIVSDTGASEIMVNTSGVTVNLEIQGRFDNGDTDGLGMWATKLVETGALDFEMSSTDGFGPSVMLESGTSSISRFTLIECLVVVSSINVTSTGWATLASGAAEVSGVPGELMALTLGGAFATTVEDLGGGDHDASAAAIAYVGGPLTIRRVSVLTAADSMGYVDSNGTWAGGDIAYPIEINTAIGTSGLSESRVFRRGGNDLWIQMTFDEDVDASSISFTITPDAGTNATLAQGPSNNVVDLTWDGPPINDVTTNGTGPQYSYRIELSGAAGGEFEIAYLPGDANCDSTNSTLDYAKIGASGNWAKTVDVAADQRADCSRDGVVSALDYAVVSAGGRFGEPNPKQAGHNAVTCP